MKELLRLLVVLCVVVSTQAATAGMLTIDFGYSNMVIEDPTSSDRNGPMTPGPVYSGNGMLDSDELALTKHILEDTTLPHHDAVHAAFTANMARATLDVNVLHDDLTRACVAGFMMLSDADSTAALIAFVEGSDSVTLDPVNYNTSLASILSAGGDPDGDGLTNKVEYDAIAGVGGPDSAKREQYLHDALFGPGEGTGSCGVNNGCPNIAPQADALYAYFGVDWHDTDADSNGIFDSFEFALALKVICESATVDVRETCDYNANLIKAAQDMDLASGELVVGSRLVELLAMMLSISTEWHVANVTGIVNDHEDYRIIGSAKATGEPLSAQGDADGDGFTNLQEYNNVIANGGDENDYVAAALNPLTNGSTPVSLASLVGLGALVGALGVAGGAFLRRKRA